MKAKNLKKAKMKAEKLKSCESEACDGEVSVKFYLNPISGSKSLLRPLYINFMRKLHVCTNFKQNSTIFLESES